MKSIKKKNSHIIIMPILRRKLNKAGVNHLTAKKRNLSHAVEGSERAFYDPKGVHREFEAEKALKKQMEKRRKGVVGLTRKIVAGKNKLERVRNIEVIRRLRKKGIIIKGVGKK
jgi:hypothetical protein